MRVKQKAIGPKTIPASDRVYFAIIKPTNTEPKTARIVEDVNNLEPIDNITLNPELKDSIAVFISSKWSLGRAIDSICELCNISNDNNKIGDSKLRLFRQLDGYCISPVKMDVEISVLMKNEILIEGDRLLIDHISIEVLNSLGELSQLFINAD